MASLVLISPCGKKKPDAAKHLVSILLAELNVTRKPWLTTRLRQLTSVTQIDPLLALFCLPLNVGFGDASAVGVEADRFLLEEICPSLPTLEELAFVGWDRIGVVLTAFPPEIDGAKQNHLFCGENPLHFADQVVAALHPRINDVHVVGEGQSSHVVVKVAVVHGFNNGN